MVQSAPFPLLSSLLVYIEHSMKLLCVCVRGPARAVSYMPPPGLAFIAVLLHLRLFCEIIETRQRQSDFIVNDLIIF